MKKKLFTLTMALFTSVCAFAQLPVGSVAPDFTLTDIDGNPQHLYSYLDSGYAVIIDVSAAWCGPCWSAHQSHVFENLTDHYGKNGTVAPGKVKVLFIEGESTNTTAQLHGSSTGSTYATFSQGDWVAGTNYPFIDNASQNANYLYGGFPSFTVICRDHLISYTNAGYGTAMGAESYWIDIINGGCPAYAPSATVDAKAIPYSGAPYFACAAAPQVKFQNYSTTQTITNAAIKVYSGTSLVTTYNWTGSLAPFAVTTVNIPSFSPTQFGPFKYEVTVAGDSQPANNISEDSIFKVYSAGNASAIPYRETFDGVTTLPYRYTTDGGNGFLYSNTGGVYQVTGANGAQTSALAFDFYNLEPNTTTEFIFGSFNTQNAPNVALDFDLAYSPYTAASPENDKLEVQVTTDCGATWTTAWTKSGASLQTRAADGKAFFPANASEWRHESVLLSDYKSSNMIVRLKGTSDYGNYCWVDNMKITPTLAVANVIAAGSVNLYPNPARTSATLDFTLSRSGPVSVQVMDAAGRTVVVAADAVMQQGAQHVDIPTVSLAAGVYSVAIRTDEGTLTRRLTVVK